MTRLYALKPIRIVAVSLLLAGCVLAAGALSHPALAQEPPPRPTLTPPAEEPDDPDDDQPSPSPTPAATATPTPPPPPPPTPTAIPPTPAQMPVTGGPAHSGSMGVMIAIGLVIAALVGSTGIGRALRFFTNRKRSP